MFGNSLKISIRISFLILISLFGCRDKSTTGIPNSDPVTGLRFISSPPASVFHNDTYFYTVQAVDNDSSSLVYEIEKMPEWLTYDDSAKMIYGRPTADNLGEFAIVVQVSNNTAKIEQSFKINVTLRQVMGETWYTYSRFKWYHDGQPLETEYCEIFSDAANDDVKEIVGEIADEKFEEILELFQFDKFEDFRYPPSYNKIQIYVNRLNDTGIAAAFWGCCIITAREAHIDRNDIYFNYVIKHELTHAFEYLIEGDVELGTDVWFREGIAEYSSRGQRIPVNLSTLESWITQHENITGNGNPIDIHQWEDFPPEVQNRPGSFYPYFELAMKYLLDDNGMGKSIQDVINVFYNARYKVPFSSAFRNNFGISMEDFKNQYFNRMRSFLSGN